MIFKTAEEMKNAYAVVMTSEDALYANIILKKGVIQNDITAIRKRIEEY